MFLVPVVMAVIVAVVVVMALTLVAALVDVVAASVCHYCVMTSSQSDRKECKSSKQDL